MKRAAKKGKKSKSVPMTGAAPFVKKAKKPENDDKPHVRAGAPSVNKNAGATKTARTKRLAGIML